jgi:hypothetical protein
MDAKKRVIAAGFPLVAELLDGTAEGIRRAWQELNKFWPCTLGEACAKSWAERALPSCPSEEEE